MINPPFAKAILAALLAISVSGCEVMRVNDTMDRVDATMEKTTQMADDLRNNKAGLARQKSVVFSDGQYVSLEPIKLNQGLPFSSDCDIVFNKDMSLQSFAQTISRTCNVRVQVTSDVYDASKESPSSGMGAQPPMLNGSMGGIFPVNSAASQAPVSTSGKSTYLSGIKWEGKLSGLLDMATAQLGLSWKYTGDDNTVSIYSLDTKTFSIFAFADETDMQSMVKSGTTSSSGAGGGSSGGSEGGGVSGESGSSQSTSVSLKTSIIKDIENAIKAMLTPIGKMSMASSTGTITVTDRPEVITRIGRYVDAENKKLTQQILLNVKVFSVTLTDKDSVGIDWNLAYKAASATTGFNLSSSFSGIESGAVTGNVGVLDGAFAGSSAIIKALSQQGKVSVVTSPSVTTLNLQPVPVQVARQTGYVASISTTNTANIGSTSSITPGTVTTGFNMDLLPSVMPNKELLLKYSINISSLIRIRSVSGGGADDETASHIEVPELDNRIFSQKVRLKSGSTLILSGFDQVSENGQKTGVGSAWNMLLGGGATRESTRDVIVVMITPVIQD